MGTVPPMAPYANDTHKWTSREVLLTAAISIVAIALTAWAVDTCVTPIERVCVRDLAVQQPTNGWMSSTGLGGGGHPVYTLGYAGTWEDNGQPCDCRVRVTERRYEREMYGEQ